MELFSRNGQLEFADGSRFKVKGINFYGLDCQDACFSGLWAQSWKFYFDLIRQKGFNLLRVPIAVDTIFNLDSSKPTTVNYEKNPDLINLTAGQTLDKIVDYCANAGILILFDNQKLHSSGSVDPLWYDGNTSEESVITAFKNLAKRYTNKPNVIGIDCKNEPWDDKLSWGTQDPRTDFSSFCSRFGDAVHTVNPRLLVFVEGLPWGPGKTNWANWGSNLEYVATSPVSLKVPDKIVYAPHAYPPGIAKAVTNEHDWQTRFGYIKDMKKAALVIGEHGSKSVPGPDLDWQNKFADWLIKKDIDNIYWCLNSSCVDSGGFLHDWKDVDPYKDKLLARTCPAPTDLLKVRASDKPQQNKSIATPMANRYQLYSHDNALWGPDGKRFYLKGTSWFGLETGDQSLQGLWQASIEQVLDFLAKNNFNFLRVPFSAQLVSDGLDTCKPTNLNSSANPALEGKSSGAQLDRLFDLCASRGIAIMLDLHRHQNTAQSPLWYTQDFPESKVVDVWKTIVNRYKDRPNFLMVDIFNEPRETATWNDDPKTGWKGAVERIGSAIQNIAPHLIIGAQGIGGNGPDGTTAGWWGGSVWYNNTNPIKLSVEKKLLFVNHVYGPSVYAQPYFSTQDFPKNMTKIWNDQWGCVSGPAVAIGEWGGWGVGNDKVWQNSLVDYLIDTKRGDSFYWCTCPTSGDTGGLLENDWTTPVSWKLELLQRLCPSPSSIPTKTQSAQQQQQSSSQPKPQATSPSLPASPNPGSASPPPQKPPPDSKFGVTVTVTMQSQYNSGADNLYQYSVTLKNTTSSPLHNVYVTPSNSNIKQIWNCEYTLSVNGQRVLSFPTWATENLLAPNCEITYGVVTTKGQSNFKIEKVIS